MAEPYITKKDLETVTQKVTIDNAKNIAQPLIDQQKKNDLKELERNIEQKVLFQDIADGIKGLGDSLLDGLKSLIPKTDGGLSKLLGLGFGLLLAPFAAFINFLSQLGRELNFFLKGGPKKLLERLKLNIKGFFNGIFAKLKNSKLGLLIGRIIDKLKNNKLFKSISSLIRKVGGKGGFFGKLVGIFTKIVKFTIGGPFKAIIGFAGKIGRILGKVFLPITILMSVFDFVKGFMRGYKEGGIIEGIKQGFMDLYDGLVGSLLRILAWIPSKIAEWLGFENISREIGNFTETFIQSFKDVFGGLVDLIVGIFTLDTDKMTEALGDIWDGITNALTGALDLAGAFIEDFFGDGSTVDKIAKKLGLPDPTKPIRGKFEPGPNDVPLRGDDYDIKKILLEPGLKESTEESTKVNKDILEYLKKNSANNGANLNTGFNTSLNTSNNVTYVIQNGSDISISAYREMRA